MIQEALDLCLGHYNWDIKRAMIKIDTVGGLGRHREVNCNADLLSKENQHAGVLKTKKSSHKSLLAHAMRGTICGTDSLIR